MGILEVLRNIQGELNAPKNQHNSYGNYNYRSAEDILCAVKPLLKKYDAVLTITDDITMVSDRIYVKATATLHGVEGGSVSTSAFAREALMRKGMDDSQVTGSASSYARKYALNGLLCIDDAKDADTDEAHRMADAKPGKKAEKPKEEKPLIDRETVTNLREWCRKNGYPEKELAQCFRVDKIEDILAFEYEKHKQEIPGAMAKRCGRTGDADTGKAG